jgi:hypothetical protein
LPAAEIAAAAKKMGAAAIGLSLVYPTDDRSLDEELKLLRRSVGPEMPIIVGGRAVGAYAETLLAIDARVSQDLATFGEILIGVSETLPGSS